MKPIGSLQKFPKSGNSVDRAVGPEEKLLADERKRALHAAIGRLSPDVRLAVHLVYFEGLSYEETARVMKKNKKQVDNLLCRAKNELRNILGKEAVGV